MAEASTRIYTGATLLAPEPLPPEHDSVATVGEHILAIGPRASVLEALESASGSQGGHEVVDLTGLVLAPGFTDAHLHPLPMCVFEHHLDFEGCTSLDDLLTRVHERAASEGAGCFVAGFQLDDELLDARRLPTREELDRAGRGLPVVILRRDGHNAIGSTAALRLAGISAATPDPPGGLIEREPDGTPTGVCRETASGLLLSPLPVPGWDDLCAATDRWAARLARQGVTAISAICQTGAEGPAGAAGELEAVAWTALAERVPFDVQTVVTGEMSAVATFRASGLHSPGARRRVDAVKLYLDGTLGGRTACMHSPYSDHPGHDGMLTLDVDDAYRRMVDAHVGGIQICVHAIGDRANATALGLYERLLREHPVVGHRHRVEHASVLDASTIGSMAALGITAVVQPVSLRSERRWLLSRLGDERAHRAYPLREMLEAGVAIVGSSDAPIESTDVLAAIHAAVGRYGFCSEQSVSIDDALAMYTSAPAGLRGTTDSGRLSAGMRADMVVLAADPRRVPTGDIVNVGVLATVAGGREIYRSPSLPPTHFGVSYSR